MRCLARSSALTSVRIDPPHGSPIDTGRDIRHSAKDEDDGRRCSSVTAIDVGPFIVVFVVGVLCGRLIASRVAWAAALALPAAHFILSVVSGRVGDDLFSYVIPINIALGFWPVLGSSSGVYGVDPLHRWRHLPAGRPPVSPRKGPSSVRLLVRRPQRSCRGSGTEPEPAPRQPRATAPSPPPQPLGRRRGRTGTTSPALGPRRHTRPWPASHACLASATARRVVRSEPP